MKKDTSTRLQELMHIKNINQVDLCQRTGIPKSSMSMYLSGERSPRQNRLSQIAEKFNISEAWLMGYDVPMERTDSLSDETLSQKDKRDILDIISSTKAELLYHKYFQITNAQNIVFKPFVECFNTSKLPLKCYI